ncbi:hypothetical protein [Actinacidiphila oryziradicis]|uniref:hypothetical protein n=1 Tax=Actinacidiphila oryziradicis TaxID=2571141 RepID=UPI00145DC197|nr:hypothetical protein [Actinacidiphila oryziradicis]
MALADELPLVVAAARAGQGRDIALSLLMTGGAQVAAHLLTIQSVTASIPPTS